MVDIRKLNEFLRKYCLNTLYDTESPVMISVLGSATAPCGLVGQVENNICCFLFPTYKEWAMRGLKDRMLSKYNESLAYEEEPLDEGEGKIVRLKSTSGLTLCFWYEYHLDSDIHFGDLNFETFIEIFGSNRRPLTIASGNCGDRFYDVVYVRLIQRFERERAREMVERLTLLFSGEDNRDELLE